MVTLFSIRPLYVDAIFSLQKRYEYRRNHCKREINKIVIYETSPTSKIVGEVSVDKIIYDEPKALWSVTSDTAGMTAESFIKYFSNKDSGTAYSLVNPIKYHNSVRLDEIGILTAPQSFIYLSEKQYLLLQKIEKEGQGSMP